MTLICFYSYTGNTRALAYRIKEKYGYDIAEIKPVKPYSDDYDKVVNEAQEDVNMNYQPEIFDVDIEKYDRIILMTPVWWYTFASPVNTFLNKYDLTGKEVLVVATNGGWLGHTFEDIERVSKVKLSDKVSLKYNNDELLEEDKFLDFLERMK